MGRRSRRKQQRGGASPLCQCPDPVTGKACENIVVRNTVFCENHQECPKPPLSGSEPPYSPNIYNDNPFIRKSHNCWSYSMQVVDPKLIKECKTTRNNCRELFHQPGGLSGTRNLLNAKERRTCDNIETLMMTDVPDIKRSSFYEKCEPGYSKIHMHREKDLKDFHFEMQHTDGRFSHKAGQNKATLIDASKQPIFHPGFADLDYRKQGSDLNYVACNFYCVPRNRDVKLGQGGSLKNRGGGGAIPAGLAWQDYRPGGWAYKQATRTVRSRRANVTKRRRRH